ncbi:MAG: hypothetical protein R6V35_01805 [Candidatus Nanohaloarchaea archaeon]
MSQQTLNLETEWKEVQEAFKGHFKSENVEIGDEMIEYSRNGEYLKIQRDGEVSGAMPLHENEFSKVDQIIFRDSEIEVKSDNFSYTFRR